MFINIKETHNPNCMKFIINFVWLDTLWECNDSFCAKKSKLAESLWNINGVVYLLFGMEFVLVTKNNEVSWEELGPVIIEVISDYLINHRKVFETDFEQELIKITQTKKSELEKKIEFVLMEKIQPALAMHGGFVKMIGFKDGVLKISLQGACKDCPGSNETLQYGIANLMKYYFPEIIKVENT